RGTTRLPRGFSCTAPLPDVSFAFQLRAGREGSGARTFPTSKTEDRGMWDVLPDRVPWYIAGPGIGLLVAGLFAVANAPLGVSGSCLQTFSLIRRLADTEVWWGWFFGRLVPGDLAATVFQ